MRTKKLVLPMALVLAIGALLIPLLSDAESGDPCGPANDCDFGDDCCMLDLYYFLRCGHPTSSHCENAEVICYLDDEEIKVECVCLPPVCCRGW